MAGILKIIFQHAQKAAAAKASVQKSVRDRLGKEKPKRDSGRVEKKEHRSKHRREREKVENFTKRRIIKICRNRIAQRRR